MTPEYLGATAALPARANRRPPCKGNPPPTPLRGNKPERKLALVFAIAPSQEAASIPVVRGSQVKQAESTVDQLGDRSLEGIPTHRHHTIIVFVFPQSVLRGS